MPGLFPASISFINIVAVDNCMNAEYHPSNSPVIFQINQLENFCKDLLNMARKDALLGSWYYCLIRQYLHLQMYLFGWAGRA